MFGRKHRARERQARAAEIAAFDAVTNRQGIAEWLRENMDLEEGPVSERREPLRGSGGGVRAVVGDGYEGTIDEKGVFIGKARDDEAFGRALADAYGTSIGDDETAWAKDKFQGTGKSERLLPNGDTMHLDIQVHPGRAEGGFLHLPEHPTFLDSGACMVPGVSIDDKAISEQREATKAIGEIAIPTPDEILSTAPVLDKPYGNEEREAARMKVLRGLYFENPELFERFRDDSDFSPSLRDEPEGEPEDDPVEKIVDFAGDAQITINPPSIATLRAHETPLFVTGVGPHLMVQACDLELEATPLTDQTMRAYWIVLGDRYRALAAITEAEGLDEYKTLRRMLTQEVAANALLEDEARDAAEKIAALDGTIAALESTIRTLDSRCAAYSRRTQQAEQQRDAAKAAFGRVTDTAINLSAKVLSLEAHVANLEAERPLRMNEVVVALPEEYQDEIRSTYRNTAIDEQKPETD